MSSSKQTILLIGPTGAGKSSLANFLVLNANFASTTILPFETSDIAASITKQNISSESNKYVVIDTSGFNDTEYAEEKAKTLLCQDLTDAIAKRGNAGFDVILVCFKMGRYTSAVDAGFNYMFDAILGPSALARTFLVVTHCDPKYVSPITASDAQREWIEQAKEQNEALKHYVIRFIHVSYLYVIHHMMRMMMKLIKKNKKRLEKHVCREWGLSSLEDTIDQFQPTIGTYTIEDALKTQEIYRKRMEQQKQASAAAAEAALREAEAHARAEAEARHLEIQLQARLEAEKKRQEAENAAAVRARVDADMEAFRRMCEQIARQHRLGKFFPQFHA